MPMNKPTEQHICQLEEIFTELETLSEKVEKLISTRPITTEEESKSLLEEINRDIKNVLDCNTTPLSKIDSTPAQAPLLLFCDDIPDGLDRLH